MGVEHRDEEKYLDFEKKAVDKILKTTGNEDFDKAYAGIVQMQNEGFLETKLKGYVVVDSLIELLRLGKIATQPGMNYEKLVEAYNAGEHKEQEKGKISYYDQISHTIFGGFEQYWIAPYWWQRDVGKETNGDEDYKVRICEDISDNTGNTLILDEVVIFAKKPKSIAFDLERYWKDGTVSNTEGALIEYEGNNAYYMVDNDIVDEKTFNKERMKRNSKLLKVLGDI